MPRVSNSESHPRVTRSVPPASIPRQSHSARYRLRLFLLGRFHLEAQGRPVELPRKKAQGLLAYLALPSGRRHSREHLAGLLWGDMDATRARHNLRQCVSALRRILGDDVIADDHGAIYLDPRVVEVDVTALEQSDAELLGRNCPGEAARGAQCRRGSLRRVAGRPSAPDSGGCCAIGSWRPPTRGPRPARWVTPSSWLSACWPSTPRVRRATGSSSISTGEAAAAPQPSGSTKPVSRRCDVTSGPTRARTPSGSMNRSYAPDLTRLPMRGRPLPWPRPTSTGSRTGRPSSYCSSGAWSPAPGPTRTISASGSPRTSRPGYPGSGRSS